MPAIADVRPVLLSAPYADPETNLEVQRHLQSGYRTCGLVEITVDDGTTGLGEGYLAVFAPRVFESIIRLLAPTLIGRDVRDIGPIVDDLLSMTGYWSRQGAAQHAVSAIEIALQDCRAKHLGVPVYELLGGAHHHPIKMYGSGGDSTTPPAMREELDYLVDRGIDLFKIRTRKDQVDKAVWCLREGQKRGIRIAIDMTQNLANPAQTASDAAAFVEEIEERSGASVYFLEEALGPVDIASYPLLRAKTNTRIAGGETVTTADELCDRIGQGLYDLAQPDATVIGGIGKVIEVFAAARRHGREVVVHCWGGPVGMMANFHAALAGGGRLVEWPMPRFPLREAMAREPWQLEEGRLTVPDLPGLGVELTEEIENRFSFREDAVYTCLVEEDETPVDGRWA